MAAPDPDEPLVIDRDGNLSIPDHEGKVLAYLWEVIPPGLDDWAVRLRRVDGQGGGPYEVTRTPGGRFACTCKDAFYGAPKRKSPCKHRVACKRLWLVKERLDHARSITEETQTR